MPDETNLPDFDSMSPEEMMAWMESLAKRQGADPSGFTTQADLDIPEVDPDTVDISSLGEYIPSNMTREQWEAQLAREAAEKAARQQANAPKIVPGVDDIEYVDDEDDQYDYYDEDEEIAIASASSELPDFDNMSPEEAMKWMESLAKRQPDVDSSGFLTTADMDVPEVDPDTVDISSLGEYIPSGMTKEQWEAQKARDAERSRAQREQQQSTPPPPADIFADIDEDEEDEDFAAAFASSEPPAADDPMAWLAGLAASDDESVPDFSALEDLGALAEATTEPAAQEEDPLSWLADLARPESREKAPPINMDELSEEPLALTDDNEEVDPIVYMESLARRQKASDDELTTAADMDIPLPEEIETDGPGYEDYSFETGGVTGLPDAVSFLGEDDEEDFEDEDMSDPASWLENLAATGGSAGRRSEDVLQRLDSGDEVTPEDIMSFFEEQFDRAEEFEEDEEAFDSDQGGVPVRAEIPEWLREQMGGVPSEPEPEPEIEDEIDLDAIDLDEVELEEVELEEEILPEAEETDVERVAQLAGILDLDDEDDEEMPDWLRQSITEEEEDISSIFASETDEAESELESPQPVVSTADMEIDTSDPWVEAFVLEQEDNEELASWYEEKVKEIDLSAPAPEASEEVEIPEEPAITLAEADLPPETSLPVGEMQDIPGWLASVSSGAAVEEPEEAEMPDWLAEDPAAEMAFEEDEDMPDWLREQADEHARAVPTSEPVLDEEDEDMPDWLRETIAEREASSADIDFSELDIEEPEVPAEVAPMPAPEPVRVPVPAAQVSPAPVPVGASAVDIAARLQSAREKVQAGDMEGALLNYESVIRANNALGSVEGDLQKLIQDKTHKENPAVYRVLGDCLMRQGKLQTALDTYRKALNLL